MIFRTLLALLFFSTSLFSQEQSEIASLPIQAKGLVLIGKASLLYEDANLKDVAGLHAIGLEIPGGLEALQTYLNPLYLGRPISAEILKEVRQTIEKYFKDHNIPLIAVTVPEQEITSGCLQMIVTVSRLGELRVVGNCHFSISNLTRYIHIQPGEEIREQTLVKNVDLMNRNPFRHVDVIYAAGKEPGTTDIILAVKDRRLFRFYAGTDNTGIESTGEERWYAGVNWGNVFNLGHLFFYQYTTSTDFHKFQAHTAQYVAPLSWGHILTIYGGITFVHAHVPFPGMKNHGNSEQASLRYTVPLNQRGFLAQDVIFGGDFKRTNNTVEFSETTEIFGKNVNLTQFLLEYNGDYRKTRFRIDYDFQVYWSPGQWIADQSNADYNSLRPGAKNHWVYGKAFCNYLQRLAGETSLYLLIEGQISNQALLPSEQFGLGGYDTVRGYKERQLNFDSAILLSGEFRSPAWHISKCKKDALQLLCFLDYGTGWNHDPSPGEPKHDYLAGVGPGIRYTYDPNLSFRFDWGIKLHRKEIFGGGFSQIYFAVVGSF